MVLLSCGESPAFPFSNETPVAPFRFESIQPESEGKRIACRVKDSQAACHVVSCFRQSFECYVGRRSGWQLANRVIEILKAIFKQIDGAEQLVRDFERIELSDYSIGDCVPPRVKSSSASWVETKPSRFSNDRLKWLESRVDRVPEALAVFAPRSVNGYPFGRPSVDERDNERLNECKHRRDDGRSADEDDDPPRQPLTIQRFEKFFSHRCVDSSRSINI
jgi:hypothetical protein